MSSLSNAERVRADRRQRMATATPDEIERDLELGKFAAPRRAADIEPVTIDWLWNELLPLGTLSLIYGPEGSGKSAFTMVIAAMVSLGKLPGALRGTPADVGSVPYEATTR